MDEEALAQLTPTGRLRVAINAGNALLVTGKTPAGDPAGIAPDLARDIARCIGKPVSYVVFRTAKAVGEAVADGIWDIALIGADPARAEAIAFTAPYIEIEATFLIPGHFAATYPSDVDRPGARISTSGGSAYDLQLSRLIKHATIVRASSGSSAYEQFVDERMDALAGLRPLLLNYLNDLPDARVLEGRFGAVQQAVGTARANATGLAIVAAIVEGARQSGRIAELISRHGVCGLSVSAQAIR